MAGSAQNAYIAGMGMYVPPKVMTNEDFAKIVDTSDEWITQMTGIKERRHVEADVATSDLATAASKIAMEKAGVTPEEIDMIVVATATPDMFFPSTACLVQTNIGATGAFAYDIVAGCSGFIYGLAIVEQFIKAGMVETALLVGAETLSKVSNMTDRNTCVLFGDGAGAAILRPCEAPKGIIDHVIGSDGSLGSLLCLPAGGSRMPASHETVDKNLHTIFMDGRKVYVNAVKKMGDSVVEVLERQGLAGDDMDILFPHQANLRIITSVAKRAEMPMEKVYVNIQKYGNTSAASIPLAMCEALDDGSLKEGMLVGLVAFGSGFTWGSTLMRW